MSYNGVPRALCDDLFDDISAGVACLELYGSNAFTSYSIGHACDYDNFWADDIHCVGTETAIYLCP